MKGKKATVEVKEILASNTSLLRAFRFRETQTLQYNRIEKRRAIKIRFQSISIDSFRRRPNRVSVNGKIAKSPSNDDQF